MKWPRTADRRSVHFLIHAGSLRNFSRPSLSTRFFAAVAAVGCRAMSAVVPRSFVHDLVFLVKEIMHYHGVWHKSHKW
ncbi:MAG: hypothetical protein AABY86_04145, partial [Bdellovibrionota bacterium]